jgi:tricorn protease
VNLLLKGKDAQLRAAIEFLKKNIAEDTRDVPKVPEYPDKSFKNQITVLKI